MEITLDNNGLITNIDNYEIKHNSSENIINLTINTIDSKVGITFKRKDNKLFGTYKMNKITNSLFTFKIPKAICKIPGELEFSFSIYNSHSNSVSYKLLNTVKISAYLKENKAQEEIPIW